ncbi:antitoxin [Bartonella henselae]|uniref:type II toxin-antitoxin system RelB family antitoxin n=1 Tax=Bartonella henselae TaxID=38323 RepID=UPI003159DC2B
MVTIIIHDKYKGKTAFSPLVSEFEIAEQGLSYTDWLRNKVAKSLANLHPVIPHDEVMAEVEAVRDQIVAEQEEL